MPRLAPRSTCHRASYLFSSDTVHCCPANDKLVLSPSTAFDAPTASFKSGFPYGCNCQAYLSRAMFSEEKTSRHIHLTITIKLNK